MSSNNPFAVLGIEEKGATCADAKRAYARKLKTTRPDDDPKAFMVLRESYEMALRYIQWAEEDRAYEESYEEDQPTEEGAIPEPETSPALPQIETVISDGDPANVITQDELADKKETVEDTGATDVSVDTMPASPPTHLVLPVDHALEKIEALITSPWGASQWPAWKAIIQDEALLGLDEFQDLSNRLRWKICQAAGMYNDGDPSPPDWLSKDLLRALNEHFGWSAQRSLDYYVREQNLFLDRIYTRKSRFGGAANHQQIYNTSEKREANSPSTATIIWRVIQIIIVVSLIGRVFAPDRSKELPAQFEDIDVETLQSLEDIKKAVEERCQREVDDGN